MSEKLTIETPELIPLEFPLAGVGSRFLALALDTLIQGVLGIVLYFTFALASTLLSRVFSSDHLSQNPGLWVFALAVLVLFVLQFGYFAFFEALWNGQTPGKRVVHLRVIKDSGRPISTFDAVARNLMRIVDSLPGVYGVGILTMLVSAQNKRLGDYVAGTVVVHERPMEVEVQADWGSAAPAAGAGYDVLRMSGEEFQLLETFLVRRHQLAPDVRARMAQQILARIAEKLEIKREDQPRREALLEALATEYRNRARFQ